MECAALAAALASIDPAITLGWFATTATGWPPRCASAQMIAGPNFGCTSNQSAVSKTTSRTARMSYTRRLPRGTMSRSSGVARGSLASLAGDDEGYDHALAGKYDRYLRMSSSTRSSSWARLWITPLASATLGPPRSSLEMSSPVDSFTTGGPAVKIAPWRLMMEKSHTGATRAPWPADGPSNPATVGTLPEHRARASRSVGGLP